MKETNLIKQFYPGLLALQILALIFLAVSAPVFAAPATETASEEENNKAIAKESLRVAKALEELLDSMNIKDFTYETEGRSDPFLPFIRAKVIQPVEVTEQEKLTGMRQFEPGQLVLVAIMFTESNPMAMVEDSSHKGYIIRRGTKIGKSGIVSDILPNQVIIKQLSYSMAREKKYKTVEMKLRKEGEK